LKRALDIDEHNAKRLKQSPLRQSITFNNDYDDENESEQGNSLGTRTLNAKGNSIDFDKLSEQESYQDSELTFEGGDAAAQDDDVDIDEIEQDYYDEEADGDYEDDGDDYDAGNQSDDEGDDDDFDDEEYAQYFEENLRQPNDESQESLDS
jgi:hypothetical protein